MWAIWTHFSEILEWEQKRGLERDIAFPVFNFGFLMGQEELMTLDNTDKNVVCKTRKVIINSVTHSLSQTKSIGSGLDSCS